MPLVRRRCPQIGRIVFGILLLSSTVAAPYGADAAQQIVRHHLEWNADAVQPKSTSRGTEISLSGAQRLQEVGRPELPYVTATYVVPWGMRMVGVEAKVSGWEELGTYDDVPLAAPLSSSDGGQAAEAGFSTHPGWRAKEGTSFPAIEVLDAGTQILHGYSLVSVHVFPVRMLQDGRIQRMRSVDLAIQLDVDPGSNEQIRRLIDWPGLRDRDRAEVEALVNNAADAERMAPPRGSPPSSVRQELGLDGQAKVPGLPEGQIDFVIVTNDGLISEFERLANARRAEGIPTAVVSTSTVVANYRNGADLQETLRNFLRVAYQNMGAQYVLLGGDAPILPPRYARSRFYPSGSYTDIPADLYFAALDGNWNADGDGIYGEAYQDFLNLGDACDMLAELSIGRAPVNNLAEAATFVDKTLEYCYPTGSTLHLGQGLFAGEVLFPQNWDGLSTITLDGATYCENIVFNSIIGGGNLMQSWRLYENYTAYIGALPETKSAVMDSLNTGRFGLVNHAGHGFYYNMSVGDNNIFVSDAQSLTNGPNYFVLYALNCSSAAFDFESLLERFVQNPNGGSVVSIGATRAAFPTTADLYQQGFFAEIFVNGNTRLGNAQRVSRAVWVGNTNVEGSHRWTHFTYGLFADPTAHMWREQPAARVVTHSNSIVMGSVSFSVTVTSSGSGVVGADVGLSRADGVVLHATTGAGGVAIFNGLSGVGDSPGTAKLVVTGQNLAPYEADVSVVVGANAHVLSHAEILDDDASAPSSGDGDGMADAGETIHWRFRFENNGNGSPANNTSATLQIVDAPGVTLIDDTVSVGNLSGGAQVIPSSGFVLDLDSTIPDGKILTFNVIISSNAGSWTQVAQLEVHAPEIEVARLSWDDSSTGNGNGIIDPGESVQLIVELVNYGSGDANLIDGILSTGSPNVVLEDPNNQWANLSLKQFSTGTGRYQIVETDTTFENFVQLNLTGDQGQVWTHEFELRAPPIPETPELDTSFGPTSIAIRMPENTVPDFYGYRVYRGLSSEGSFEEVTSDRLEQTGFFLDSGLAALTRYFYQVTMVDSSMVESEPSLTAEASTSPPEMAGGFPLPILREMAGALAVGDMRGDGSKVVAFGSDFVFAIDSHGQELVDGDNNSQTLGPLGGNPSQPRMTPSGVAMANLDGVEGVEVVAGAWDAREIWVLDANGNSSPGWPRLISARNWATPSIGDLDNNGDLEIVINNVVGDTYVFNHDGTDFFDGDGNPGTVGIFHRRPGEVFNRSTPSLYDVDGDGTLEILFGTHFKNGADNYFYVFKNDATQAPGWPKLLGPGGYSTGHVGIADLDGDELVEIIFMCDDDNVYIWRPDGSDYPGYPRAFVNNASNVDSKTPAAAFGDFDENGDLEMVLVSIETGKRCKIYLKDHDFSTRPGWPVELPGLSESSPLVADINGDHSLDIVFGIGGGSDNSPNVLYAFNQDGTPVQGFPITLPGAVRPVPVITDFDGDGDVDVVYAGYDRFLHVWDMPFTYRYWLAPWATFQGNNRRTGVYLEDVAVGTLVATMDLHVGPGGVVLESYFSGAPVDGLELHVEREQIDGTESGFVRLANSVAVDAAELIYVDSAVQSGATYRYRLVDDNGAYEFRSESITVPAMRAALHPGVPNPFNPSTTLVFEVPATAGSLVPTRLEIFDAVGRRVRVLQDGPLSPGTHRAVWNGRDENGLGVGSGVYYARLLCAGEQRSTKLTLVK